MGYKPQTETSSIPFTCIRSISSKSHLIITRVNLFLLHYCLTTCLAASYLTNTNLFMRNYTSVKCCNEAQLQLPEQEILFSIRLIILSSNTLGISIATYVTGTDVYEIDPVWHIGLISLTPCCATQ